MLFNYTLWVWYGYGMVWVWYGMVWYGMVWYGYGSETTSIYMLRVNVIYCDYNKVSNYECDITT